MFLFVADRGLSNPMVLKTVLTIYNLTVEDYGTYTCVVHSPFGSERGSTEVIGNKDVIKCAYTMDIWNGFSVFKL